MGGGGTGSIGGSGGSPTLMVWLPGARPGALLPDGVRPGAVFSGLLLPEAVCESVNSTGAVYTANLVALVKNLRRCESSTSVTASVLLISVSCFDIPGLILHLFNT